MRPVPAWEKVLALVLVQVELRRYLAQLEQKLAENWLGVPEAVVYVVMILDCLNQLQKVGGEEEERNSVVGVVVVGIREGRSMGDGRHWQSEAVYSVCQLDMCRS